MSLKLITAPCAWSWTFWWLFKIRSAGLHCFTNRFHPRKPRRGAFRISWHCTLSALRRKRFFRAFRASPLALCSIWTIVVLCRSQLCGISPASQVWPILSSVQSFWWLHRKKLWYICDLSLPPTCPHLFGEAVGRSEHDEVSRPEELDCSRGFSATTVRVAQPVSSQGDGIVGCS